MASPIDGGSCVRLGIHRVERCNPGNGPGSHADLVYGLVLYAGNFDDG